MVGWEQTNLSGKLAETKTATLNMMKGYWTFTTRNRMKPDIAILWCVSKNGKNIERGL